MASGASTGEPKPPSHNHATHNNIAATAGAASSQAVSMRGSTSFPTRDHGRQDAASTIGTGSTVRAGRYIAAHEHDTVSRHPSRSSGASSAVARRTWDAFWGRGMGRRLCTRARTILIARNARPSNTIVRNRRPITCAGPSSLQRSRHRAWRARPAPGSSSASGRPRSLPL